MEKPEIFKLQAWTKATTWMRVGWILVGALLLFGDTLPIRYGMKPVVGFILVWGLRSWAAYLAWVTANGSFRESKNPWRSAFYGAAWILGIALTLAVMVGRPHCDEMEECEDGDYVSLSGRISIGFWTIGVLGVPTLIAGLQHKAKFEET